MASITLSIAMCTCNGARYLPQQLASIAAQTRLPDELIICDDQSTDLTRSIIAAFARTSSFPVYLITNHQRIGPTPNFEQAIRACRGQIIALADQDDLWHPQKLALLHAALAPSLPTAHRQRPTASFPAFAFSDADLTDESLHPLQLHLWDVLGPTPHQRRLLAQGLGTPLLTRQNLITGATLAFLSSYTNLIFPIPKIWFHDAWIALIFSAMAPCIPIEQPLLKYRQHPHQVTGARRHSLFQQFQTARKMDYSFFQADVLAWQAAYDRFYQFRHLLLSPRLLQTIESRLAHAQARLRMRQSFPRRLPLIAREIFLHRYRRHSLGWKSVAQDIFL